MDEMQELKLLRRLAELEAKAGGPPPAGPEFEDPGIAESLLIGAGRTVDRVGKGMKQLYYGATNNKQAQDALRESAADDDRAYQPLQKARPWSTGIGESIPSMVIPAGGAASVLGNMGRMAVAGAAPGALEYGSLEERGKRAAIGAAAGAAVPVAVLAAKTGKSLIEPLWQGGRETIAGRTMNRVAGKAAPEVQQRMSSASSLVPGSLPTAAEVAESGGIAALQRSASAANPEAYTQRAMEQASARMNALRGIAGDDAGMAAAEAARKAAAQPLYEAADAAVVPIDNYFAGLLNRPQFASAVKRAEELAKNEGLESIFFRGSQGEPVAMVGQGAHYIKKALDEAAERGSTSYTGQAGSKAAGNTQAEFLQWLEKSAPEYNQAKQAFAQGSRPINQMQVGRELMNQAAPALADFGALGRESGAQFARAMRNGDATAAKATGMSGADMSSVMDPQQLATLQAIAKDLARKTNAQDLGRGVGSDTFQKLSMQNIAEQSGMPRLTGGLLALPGMSRATSWAYRDVDEQMRGLLADALLDPKKAAALMKDAGKQRLLPNSPKARKALEQAAFRSAALGLLAGTNE